LNEALHPEAFLIAEAVVVINGFATEVIERIFVHTMPLMPLLDFSQRLGRLLTAHSGIVLPIDSHGCVAETIKSSNSRMPMLRIGRIVPIHKFFA
jgi:hypothetical protein